MVTSRVELEEQLKDVVIRLAARGCLTCPGREPHTWRNASKSVPCEVLWALAPAP